MRFNGRLPAASLLGLLVASCGTPGIALPKDPQERAATCYAAKLALFNAEKGGAGAALTVEQANEAAHFLFLGASTNGIAEPTKARALAARGVALEKEISTAKSAQGYVEPCAKAYPQTAATAFKGLAPDDRDTRMMCFSLANALVQIYQASDVPPVGKGLSYGRLHAALDERITREVEAESNPNIAELAGRAVRGLALAAEAGPPSLVMDACVARYLPK
jgi:hypothetical protein